MISKKVVQRFSASIVEQPIIYRLVKDFDLTVNILKADINPRKEGSLVLELTGRPDNYGEGIKFLEHLGVSVEPLSQTVVWDEKRCTSCGACTGVCPVAALHIQRPSMEVAFDNTKCVVCGMCVLACPVRAVEFRF
ncbi:MAG: 4Fe-4S binding protein [Firmicutes bacterium]|nr:4Fe-4S binding protein [Bacillota bacterium]